MTEPKFVNRTLGYGLSITGLLLVGINFIARSVADIWFPKLLIVGIVVACLGVSMIFFPPHNANMDDRANYFKEVFRRTSKFSMLMWLVALIASGFLVVWVLGEMNFTL